MAGFVLTIPLAFALTSTLPPSVFRDDSQLSNLVGCPGENQHHVMPVGGMYRLQSEEGQEVRLNSWKIFFARNTTETMKH